MYCATEIETTLSFTGYATSNPTGYPTSDPSLQFSKANQHSILVSEHAMKRFKQRGGRGITGITPLKKNLQEEIQKTLFDGDRADSKSDDKRTKIKYNGMTYIVQSRRQQFVVITCFPSNS